MDEADIYREEILEHFRHPQNFGTLEKPGVEATVSNPLCGDVITLQLSFDAKDKVSAVAFSGASCAVSTASSSKCTEWMHKKTRIQLEKVSREDVLALFGAPVGPAREHCVLLIHSALRAALLI